ncbi:RHS repeat-associated core domain-containing protein [Serratia sp. OS31]|uniref:RHS repeat protein n=1 Tax=Serratia sp. OS31 TaxID=2760844 RepID=UPI00351CAC1E
MSTSLFSKTPTVTVLDNRGLTVRDIAYHRHPGSPDVTSERITRHQYDARGFLTQSADPRLHDAGLANFSHQTDLSGNALRSQSVDNGITVVLNDASGRPFLAVSNISTADDGTEERGQAVTRTWQYEAATLPGRPVSITEQVTGETARVTECFVYAGNSAEEKALNLAGQCVSHYDTAGLMQTNSVALTGMPLSVIRRLLKDADNPETVANWQGTDASAWNDLLADESERHTTLTTADATGAVLTTTDAKRNQQRVAYDVAGLLSGSWLTVKDGSEQVIVKSLSYSAAGQKLREEHGNGVVTTYAYEPETQRLVGIKTERPAGHASGAKVLQDLRYDYDLVGNVLKVSNDAEETRFWRNQKVVPENVYVYDSLYQLVSTTGREMANAGLQSSSLPSATFLPTDSPAYTNYTHIYTYDEAGNLTRIRHSAPATNNNYTTAITISDSSNRGVLSSLTEKPADVDALFTAGGQQTQLQPGQSMTWTTRNELLKVTPVVRDGSTDDGESYRYDAGGQRILKISVQNTGSCVQAQRALYLPGLELRSTKNGDTEIECLQVITVGEAGRALVRVLHWESGKPNGINNGQVRYSYDNLIGSSGLEVDGEGQVISMEEYYPYGGSAILTARSQVEAGYKTVRYSGKERDATGLYYYGYRYYQPWAGRWLSADPAGVVDGLNLFRMVRNNPIRYSDKKGMTATEYNLYSSNSKNTVVYRVEPLDFNENFTHTFIEKDNARIYYPPAPASGTIHHSSSEGEKNSVSYETIAGKGYVKKLSYEEKKMFNTGLSVDLSFIEGKITPSGKQGLSYYEYSRNYLANNRGQPLGTMGWLGFNSPSRANDFYNQKMKNEGDKLTFVVKSFEIPSGVYKAIAETAITEDIRSSDRTAPINVDIVAAGQLGLQSHHLDLINRFAINGSAKIYQGDEVNQLRTTESFQSGSRVKYSPIRNSESTRYSRVKFTNSLRQ